MLAECSAVTRPRPQLRLRWSRVLLLFVLVVLDGAAASASAKYVKVASGTCESNQHLPIESKPECTAALQEVDHLTVTWGPNGGFHDVVDGCSVRDKTQLFCNDKKTCVKGSSTPDWVPGANGKATCACSAWQPCLFWMGESAAAWYTQAQRTSEWIR